MKQDVRKINVEGEGRNEMRSSKKAIVVPQIKGVGQAWADGSESKKRGWRQNLVQD